MKRFPVAIAAICIGIFVSTSQLAVAQDKDQRSCPAELNKNGPDAIFRMLTEQGVAKAFDQRGEEIESDLALMNAALEAYQEAGGKQDSGTRLLKSKWGDLFTKQNGEASAKEKLKMGRMTNDLFGTVIRNFRENEIKLQTNSDEERRAEVQRAFGSIDLTVKARLIEAGLLSQRSPFWLYFDQGLLYQYNTVLEVWNSIFKSDTRLYSRLEAEFRRNFQRYYKSVLFQVLDPAKSRNSSARTLNYYYDEDTGLLITQSGSHMLRALITPLLIFAKSRTMLMDAVGEQLQSRSTLLKRQIAEGKLPNSDGLVAGAGLHGVNLTSGIKLSKPYARVTVVEKQRLPGGPFRTGEGLFYINSRTRPTVDSFAGLEAGSSNLNTLVGEIQTDDFPQAPGGFNSSRDWAEAITLNAFISGAQFIFESQIVGFDASPEDGPEAAKMQILLSTRDDTEDSTVYTLNGRAAFYALGKRQISFPNFRPQAADLFREFLDDPKSGVYTYPGFQQAYLNGETPDLKDQVIAIIGAKDGGRTLIELLSSYSPPEAYEGRVGADGLPRRILLIGESCVTCLDYVRNNRARYANVAALIKSGILIPVPGRLIEANRGRVDFNDRVLSAAQREQLADTNILTISNSDGNTEITPKLLRDLAKEAIERQEMLNDVLGGPVPNQALTPSDITQIDAYPSIVIYSGGNTENVEGLLTNIFGEGPLMDPETGRRLTESNPFLKSGFVTEENISGSSPSFGLINSGFLQIVEPDPDSNDTRRLPIYIVGVANGDSVIPEGDRLGIEENSQANFLWVPRVWSFSQAAAARITERD